MVSFSGGSDYTGQAGCDGAQEGRGPWGEEAFWNPGGRRRGGRGELQGPCNHCFAEGMHLHGQALRRAWPLHAIPACLEARAVWMVCTLYSLLLRLYSPT